MERLRYAWRTVSFVAVFIVMLGIMFVAQLGVMTFFVIFRPTGSRKLMLHKAMWRVCRWLLHHIPGVGVDIINRSGEDFSRPAIIVANHQSHLDLLCLLALTPRVVFMAKRWVWRNPLYGIIIRYADFIPSDESFDRNVERMANLAACGYSTVIFPEGTRSATLRMGRFHRGAFHAAARLGMDVVPVALHGTGRVMNKHTFAITPGRITIEILPRITVGAEADADVRSLAREAREAIERCYNEIERDTAL